MNKKWVKISVLFNYKNPPDHYVGLVHDRWSIAMNRPEDLHTLILAFIRDLAEFYADIGTSLDEINSELDLANTKLSSLRMVKRE